MFEVLEVLIVHRWWESCIFVNSSFCIVLVQSRPPGATLQFMLWDICGLLDVVKFSFRPACLGFALVKVICFCTSFGLLGFLPSCLNISSFPFLMKEHTVKTLKLSALR